MTLRYLHNEYLQVLVEDGAIGGSLLLAVLITGVRAARHPSRTPGHTARPTSTSTNLRTGGVAAMGAFAISSAVDIPWHLPVLPVLLATLFALTLTTPRPSPQPTPPTETPTCPTPHNGSPNKRE